MTMKFKNIIIDSNNVFHRNYCVFEKSINDKTIYVEAIKGFLKSVAKYERDYLAEDGKIYFVFDNCSSKEKQRKLLYENYKANRPEKPKAYYKTLETLQFILLHKTDNYFLIYRSSYEADDLVYPLIKTLNENDRTLLVSNDLDWARCIDNNVYWCKQNEIISKESFQDIYKFAPTKDSIVLYKIFTGDESDNIPKGCPYLPHENIIQIVNQFKNVYDLLENLKKADYLTEEWKQRIIEHKSQLKINAQLVDFIDIKESEFSEFVFSSKFSSTILRGIFKTLDIKISEYAPEVLKHFPEKPINKNDFFELDTIDRE